MPLPSPPVLDREDTEPIAKDGDAPAALDAIVRPLTPRGVHAAVWALAWPSVTTMLLQTVNSMLDVFFVGHLPDSAQALAATGVGGGVMFLLISLSMGVSVGTTALVARFTGAGDPESAVEAAGQSITLSAILGLAFGALTYLVRVPLVGLMLDAHRSPEAAHLCVRFLEMALLGSVPLFVMNALVGALRGLGDTRTPMLITVATVVTHISGNIVFIYGNLRMPRLGVAGAGLALALSLVVGLVLYLLAMRRHGELAGAMEPRHLRFRPEWAMRILRVGTPAALQAVIRTLGMMSFTGMLAHTLEGAAGVAALQIGVRAESIAFMPGFGYSVAASALVGQSLGAREPYRAERFGWAATAQAVAVMTAMAVLFFVLADWLPHLFTQDASVRALGADYLRVNAFCEPFLALGMVLTGALQGAGDTVRPTFITFFTMWVARIPLGLVLMFTLHQNTHGAWVAMSLTTILGGLMTVALFRSGAWKRIKV
jgi:putative MATE family efflux protein